MWSLLYRPFGVWDLGEAPNCPYSSNSHGCLNVLNTCSLASSPNPSFIYVLEKETRVYLKHRSELGGIGLSGKLPDFMGCLGC